MKWLLIGLVRGYQLLVSPLLGPTCRYYPSCSAYAVQALQVHGAIRGSWLAARRLLRCHPAPSGKQLLVLGNACEIEYHADHVLTENECSLDAEELDLLLLRAQAEAMRELSMKNATTAYQLREGISATPKNGTPAYLYQELLAEFERRLMR